MRFALSIFAVLLAFADATVIRVPTSYNQHIPPPSPMCEVHGKYYNPGESVTWRCPEGKKLNSLFPKRTCKRDGRWDYEGIPYCMPMSYGHATAPMAPMPSGYAHPYASGSAHHYTAPSGGHHDRVSHDDHTDYVPHHDDDEPPRYRRPPMRPHDGPSPRDLLSRLFENHEEQHHSAPAPQPYRPSPAHMGPNYPRHIHGPHRITDSHGHLRSSPMRVYYQGQVPGNTFPLHHHGPHSAADNHEHRDPGVEHPEYRRPSHSDGAVYVDPNQRIQAPFDYYGYYYYYYY